MLLYDHQSVSKESSLSSLFLCMRCDRDDFGSLCELNNNIAENELMLFYNTAEILK